MKSRQFTESYLRFSKRERIGILAIIVFVGLVYLLPGLFAKSEGVFIAQNALSATTIDTLKIKQTHESEETIEEQTETAFQYEPSVKREFTNRTPFTFDPNILSKEGWQKLGLNERTIKTLINYRNKGGKFYKKEDLQKIWGLPDGFYDFVKDYISIRTSSSLEKNYSGALNSKTERKVWNIELNSADTIALVELPGIGSKLAQRIINFRDRLGGFYSIDQVGETYGLADSIFKKIKPYLHINGGVKKININTATRDELKLHPYIKWNLANILVEYRNQHGHYKSIEELKNISSIDERLFLKIAPYLYKE
jgi:DNA uptake protein ComE-like DNA-binding protein